MLRIDFTQETVFSFEGPNLCLLGNQEDFLRLAKSVVELTGEDGLTIDLYESFSVMQGNQIRIYFSSRKGFKDFGVFKGDSLVFELDQSHWDRIFRFFVLMSWNKRTYYLNNDEDALFDLELRQECHLICSSEWP